MSADAQCSAAGKRFWTALRASAEWQRKQRALQESAAEVKAVKERGAGLWQRKINIKVV